MVIFPLSTSTLSLKFKTISASTSTDVALSAGVDESRVGFVLSEKNSISLIWWCTPDFIEVT